MTTEAILFDLDGTLLDIDMDRFLAGYFAAMEGQAREQGLEGAEKLVAAVWKATEVMVRDVDPRRTNREVFEEAFFARFPQPPQVMRPFFERFYATAYRELGRYCRPFPGMRDIVADAFARGLRVAVATNPLFPLTALEQRLAWGGVGDFPYQVITSYEVMHFAKPQAQYYLEIAAMLGVEPERCLMVGNDRREDLSAVRVGMRTFLLCERVNNPHHDEFEPDWQGGLAELAEVVAGLGNPGC